MTDVLLSKDYNDRKAGTIMQNLGLNEAKAIESIGLGEILQDEPLPETPAPAPKAKGEKAGTE